MEAAHMEAMRILIEDIRRSRRDGHLKARFRVISSERVLGMPRALIRMTIQLDDPLPGTTALEIRRMARDEALRFLDVL